MFLVTGTCFKFQSQRKCGLFADNSPCSWRLRGKEFWTDVSKAYFGIETTKGSTRPNSLYVQSLDCAIIETLGYQSCGGSDK